MSLLQNLSYREYQHALEFSLHRCEVIARLANMKITYTNTTKPGETLIKALDRAGISAPSYKKLVADSAKVKTFTTYYKPKAKIAILVANDRYTHLSRLATPSIDCDSLAALLKKAGFIAIKIKNTTGVQLKLILAKIFDLVEEDSYCKNVHPSIFSSINTVEQYTVHKNLLVAYSSQSSQNAYEELQIECSTTINNDQTYELKTGDTDKIVPGASQYVNSLCTRIDEDLDANTLLDKVHEDVEKSVKKQKPTKVQCGVDKRSLYDPPTGDTQALQNRLREATQEYNEYCVVY
ncbi:hypothetical protein HF086_001944 [Spodoptera exigua]|uniref:Caspase family p20 domain-containing protein n=1 Tax=Spodoptera exigua TaxID=7107 RepID=A0A922MET0_SPOEX|nr:hypothetical protein HF086_001944 [Spodoptera exigua]